MRSPKEEDKRTLNGQHLRAHGAIKDKDQVALEIAYQRLRAREAQAAELLERWFNLANNVVGAPGQETIDWLGDESV